jgi:Type IV secretion system pilin
MKSLRNIITPAFIAMALVLTGILFVSKSTNALAVGASCDDFRGNTLLGIPAWYKYLPGEGVQQISRDGTPGDVVCQPTIKTVTSASGEEEKIPINNILLIVAAIIEILIRVAGLAAFIYLIYGGFMYLTSSGNSEQVGKAGTTLLNAAIGLGIAISATAIINFFAGRFKGP